MKEVLISLLAWIGANTSYDVDVNLPNIAMTDRYNICVLYGIKSRGQCDAAKLQGFYNKAYTIHLRSEFDVDDPNDQSRLLHELIHYVQWSNHQQKNTCLGRLEVEAYELQDVWRVSHQLVAILDPFKKLMLEASCDA